MGNEKRNKRKPSKDRRHHRITGRTLPSPEGLVLEASMSPPYKGPTLQCEEILQELLAGLGKHRLGVELDAF